MLIILIFVIGTFNGVIYATHNHEYYLTLRFAQAVLNSLFGLYSFYLIVQIYRLLFRQGTSRKLKKNIVIRYLLLYFIFLPNYVMSYFDIIHYLDVKIEFHILGTRLENTLIVTIVFIPLIRLSEPIVIFSLKKFFKWMISYNCFRKKNSQTIKEKI